MKIAITGACGSIGSYLIEHLRAEIVAVDALKSFYIGHSPGTRIPLYGKRLKFYESDILSDDLHTMFRECEKVIHLAALTDVRQSYTQTQSFGNVNVKGAVRVAKACGDLGIKMIFPSTTSVYGTNGLVTETMPCSPETPYSAQKLDAEHQISQHCDSVVFRLGGVFGFSPNMNFNTVIPKFCWQAKRGQPLTVFKFAYNQIRPYVHLKDIAEAVTMNLPAGVYNLALVSAAIKDIITEIEKSCKVEMTFVESKSANDLSYWADTSKIENEGFKFRGTLEDGIKEIMERL